MRFSDLLKQRPELLDSGAVGITTIIGEIVVPLFPLKHSCKGCAKCCYYNPDIIDKEAENIAKFLGLKKKDFTKRLKMKRRASGLGVIWGFNKKLGEPCPFLKDNRCSIYASRPLSCRLYPYQMRWDNQHPFFILQPYCDTGQSFSIKSKEDAQKMQDSKCEAWEYCEELKDRDKLLEHLDETIKNSIIFVLERLSTRNANKLKTAWKK